MKRLLSRMLDETAFLSDFGVRSLSKFYGENPYVFERAGHRFSIGYVPGDSATEVFGGNSNWRGPIWMPVNFLLIESLYRFHSYYGDDFRIECPVGSGTMLHLGEVAAELSRRLCRIFLRGPDGRTTGFRRLADRAEGSAFPRQCAVLRILSRRHRPRSRRLAPDRLDRAGRPAAALLFQGGGGSADGAGGRGGGRVGR